MDEGNRCEADENCGLIGEILGSQPKAGSWDLRADNNQELEVHGGTWERVAESLETGAESRDMIAKKRGLNSENLDPEGRGR